MADTKLISPGIPNYTLKRNLRLNDNYLSNDGGDEGIRISDSGPVSLYYTGVAHSIINLNTATPLIQLTSLIDSDDYTRLQCGTAGEFTITTEDSDGANAYFKVDADGYISLNSTGNITLDAEGDKIFIDTDLDSSSATTTTGLHVDFDRVGAVTSGTDTNIGLDLDVNATGAGTSGTPTVNSYGIDLDVVGDNAGSGTSTVSGIDINVSGADTNYALITAGGNVGIGEAAPQDTLEVNGTIMVKDALKFTQDDGNEYIDSLNDEYLDLSATTGIRLKQDTLIESTKKLYFNDAGGEHISGDGDDLTIVAGTDLALDGGSFIKLYDNTVHYATFSKGAGDVFNIAAPAGNIRLAPHTDKHISLGGGTGFIQITATFDATDTDIDFRDGNKQILTLTADITDVHFQFPAVSGNFLCIFLQDGTGGWDVSNWKTKDVDGNPGAGNSGVVKWAGGSATTLTETGDKADIISIYWDATNGMAYAVASENF